MAVRWDIFCCVVDNYGDIGVTWRLARQLALEYGLEVRLWVDEPGAFRRLCPQADGGAGPWRIDGVEVRQWPVDFPAVDVADVVIEAFACSLPERYVAAMAERTSPALWLNLEYLSAEDWVAGCHGLPSPQPGGLRKFFFFPGFTESTGGLLREADVLLRRRAFQADAEARRAFLAGIGIVPWAGARMISLFAYENAALAGWLDALAAAAEPTQLLVPRGRIEADLCRWLGVDTLEDGGHWRRANLQVHLLPFLSQADYDRLLWCCDFNAVRGEDSFVRAQWAGRPLLWHIYQQEEGAHWEKLGAFLDSYCAALTDQAASALRALWSAWNGKGDMAQAWQGLAEHGEQLAAHAEHWCQEQASRPDLAAALVQFHRNWLSCAA
jgi:uncharacterized repeat protein (TIGR03837 family)